MNKRLKLIFVILIFITMLLPFFGGIFKFDFTSRSSGSIVMMPNIIVDDKLNTKFTSQFDDYYSESFPLRSMYVSLYHSLSMSIFNETSNEKVIVGDDGMLYFNETLRDFQRLNTLNDEEIMRLDEVFRILKTSLSNSNSKLYFMVAPNKSSVYPEFMPDKYTVFEHESNLDLIQSKITSIPIIDVKSEIIRYKVVYSELLYHKLDSHWNNLGAYIAYVHIMKEINEDYLPFDLFDLASKKDWRGDLTNMIYPALNDFDLQYDLNLPETFTFTRPIRQLDDLQIESINAEGINTLVMFRDSFANALIPYLSQSFSQSYYYRNFPYDFRNIDSISPDYLILEIAERNIPWLLQATPVVLSKPISRNTMAAKEIDLSYEITITNQSNYKFINAYFDDQKVASKITAIKFIHNDYEMNGFPIYQDNDYQDNEIHVGFSAYVDTSFDMNEHEVYVFMEGLWYRISE